MLLPNTTRTATGDQPPSVLWDDAFCGGAWVLKRYADVSAALRDPRFSVRRASRWINSAVAAAPTPGPGLDAFKRVFSRSLLFLDGRAHRRLRGIVNGGFKPADLMGQSAAIGAIAQQLIGAICARARTGDDGRRSVQFDFVADFARPLPALVIARMMGVPLAQSASFVDGAADLAAFIGSPMPSASQAHRAQQALAAMADFFGQVMAGRGAEPGDDLVGRIMQARQQHRMSHIEALAQCCTLLLAGYETTRNLLGSGLLALLKHPAQWARLKTSPDRLRPAIREMLRYDSPVQYTGRRLVDDVQVGGQQLRRGDLAILHIGAANHDPQRFTAPRHFDIDRDQGNHLAFGHGPHVCVGAALTTMEAEIAFEALMQAMPELQLLPPDPRWQPDTAYRALARLPLICHLAPTATS